MSTEYVFNPDWRERQAEVGQITDQAVLAEIASADFDEDVRLAAVLRLGECLQ